MSFTLCSQCKSIYVMSKTGQYCDNCFYGANKAQAMASMIKWNDFSEKRIQEQKLKELEELLSDIEKNGPPLVINPEQLISKIIEEQTELDKLKQRIIDFQQEVPLEFEETFKKRFKDILA